VESLQPTLFSRLSDVPSPLTFFLEKSVNNKWRRKLSTPTSSGRFVDAISAGENKRERERGEIDMDRKGERRRGSKERKRFFDISNLFRHQRPPPPVCRPRCSAASVTSAVSTGPDLISLALNH